MQIAVIGTGTEVGKTIISAIIARRYGTPHTPVSYWKPIASGAEDGSDADTVAKLALDHVRIIPNCYTYAPPVSPHLAGRLSNNPVVMSRLLQQWQTLNQENIVVEGIGGLLVPLNDDGDLYADFLQQLRLPTVLVASSQLGTINHTLLTLEAARARQINIVGVVMNGPLTPSNSEAVARFGRIPILANVAPITDWDSAAFTQLAMQFDTDGVLA